MMRARFVNEAYRLLTDKDLIQAICAKLKKEGKSGDAIKSDNWKQQTKRGTGVYTSDFFNSNAGLTVTVEYTDDAIIDIQTNNEEEDYSPFGNAKPKQDSTSSNDFFDLFSKEREKEKETFSHAGEYEIKNKPKRSKKNKEKWFSPNELAFHIVSDKPVIVTIRPKDNTEFNDRFAVRDILFVQYFKEIAPGIWATILEKKEAEKFLKNIGLTLV